MEDTTQIQAEPQRHTEPRPPQRVHEKTPIQDSQAMQFVPYTAGQQPWPLGQPPSDGSDERPFSRKWHLARIILGSASLVVSAVIWAICIVMLVRNTHADLNSDSTLFEAPYAMAVSALAIIWQVAEFITLWSSKTKRGIHPGAHVGLHLIIWLATVLLVVFMGFIVCDDVIHLGNIQLGTDDSYWSYSTGDFAYYDVDSFAAYLRCEEALLAFLAALVLIHFVLFVRACTETHEYNRFPAARTVYVHLPVAAGSLPLPGQQLMGYYTYQPLPGQSLPFAQPQGGQGAPVSSPQLAQQHGYYAPASAPSPQPRAPEHGLSSTERGSSATVAGSQGPSTHVAPAPFSEHQ